MPALGLYHVSIRLAEEVVRTERYRHRQAKRERLVSNSSTQCAFARLGPLARYDLWITYRDLPWQRAAFQRRRSSAVQDSKKVGRGKSVAGVPHRFQCFGPGTGAMQCSTARRRDCQRRGGSQQPRGQCGHQGVGVALWRASGEAWLDLARTTTAKQPILNASEVKSILTRVKVKRGCEDQRAHAAQSLWPGPRGRANIAFAKKETNDVPVQPSLAMLRMAALRTEPARPALHPCLAVSTPEQSRPSLRVKLALAFALLAPLLPAPAPAPAPSSAPRRRCPALRAARCKACAEARSCADFTTSCAVVCSSLPSFVQNVSPLAAVTPCLSCGAAVYHTPEVTLFAS